MVQISLECAIAGQAATFDVTVDDGMKVSALKVAIKQESENTLADVDAEDLQLFLAKKEDGKWLDGAGVVAVTFDEHENPRGFEHMTPSLWLKNVKYFGENFTPGEGQVHVLVVVPEVESQRPESEEMQQKKLLNALEWREPMRLCTSDGQDWAYQGAPELVAELARPLVTHYKAWKLGYEGKQNHAINLVVGGTGTGKSRMLDEMKELLCEAAKKSQQQELVERMENAYVFRVTFEDETSSTGTLLDSECPEFDVSYRMLYQLAKDRKDWMLFVDRLLKSYPSLRLRIETVMEILATLEKVDNLKDMTVILCVDGLQKLSNDGTMTCALYRVLASICGFLNSSRAFAVCVCSTAAQTPVEQALSVSQQKRVYLSPPALRGEEVLKSRTRLEKLLVDDMGGHGRALETLARVLRQYTKDELEQTDPTSVLDQVCSQLRVQHGEIFASPLFQDTANCQTVLAAILSRRRYCMCECVVPDMTVDQLRSFGMFRFTPGGNLECAFVIFLMLLRTLPQTSGDVASFDEHFTRIMLGWPRFEEFVAFYRRVKSMVYWGTPVKLSTFHSGARFGSIHDIMIEELEPRTGIESTSQQVSKSGSGDSNRHGVADVSEMGTIAVNGASASAGDICTRIQLTTSKEKIVCNEVIRCKLMQNNQKKDKTRYEEERTKAVNVNTDVVLLITTSDDVVDPFDLPERCGLVSKAEFDRYFGPFASRGHRSLQEPPNINTHELSLEDGVGAATAEKVIDERRKRRLSSHEDAASRLFPASKKCKTAEVLHALQCDGEEDEALRKTAFVSQDTTVV